MPRGRPKGRVPNVKESVICVRISPTMRAALEKAADHRDDTMSRMCRKILLRWMHTNNYLTKSEEV